MRFKLLSCAALVLIIVSCQGKRMVHKPEDLIFTKELYEAEPKAVLNNEDIKKDINLLVYALNHGYGAKGFLPEGQLETALSKLKKLKDKTDLSEQEFCDSIGDILWDIQDGHLNVKSRGKLCGKQNEWSERKGSVGKNFAIDKIKASKIPWYIEEREVNGKNLGLISIAYYPSHQDKVWEGFMERAKTLLNKDAIIIDLRGNEGGDDTMGFELASLMQDRQLKPGWDKTIVNQSAETYALQLNNFIIRELNFKKSGQEVPAYVTNFLTQHRQNLDNAKAGKLEATKEYTWDQAKFPIGANAYKGKVIILSDRECISSGESSLEVLAKHPNAKVYGENTGGKYHFGNVSSLVLPTSKVLIGIASKYNGHSDGRNIDKVGIAPDINVESGTDALEFILQKKSF